MIGKDYFKQKHFAHETTNNIIVKIYKYSPYAVFFLEDISDDIIEYSYDCDYANNIRQSAAITVKTDVFSQKWYMRRENKQYEWVNADKSIQSVTWEPGLYQLIKTYTDTVSSEVKQIDLGFFVPTGNDYDYSAATGQVTINLSGLSAILTKEYGGSVTTFRRGVIFRDPDTHQIVEKTFPTTLSVEEGLSIDGKMLFDISMGSNATYFSFLNISAPVPLVDGVTGFGQKLYSVPYQIDFDADVGRMDMLEKISEVAFENGKIWVDENRILHMSSRPVTRGTLVMNWRDYSELFVSEAISYEDSGFYNITEVYGKDNEYYAIYGNDELDAGYIRKQIIFAPELTSNAECLERAKWETYKNRYGRETITVTLADKYIPQFTMPSNRVGGLIEYTTVDGDTNLYFLNKLSYSDTECSMELQIFKPLYMTDDIRYNMTLKRPEIYKHEVINNNTLRLYIRGEDIQDAVVKIYGGYGGQSYEFIVESCNTDGDDTHDYKIADIPIDKNGRYFFYAALYSPYKEDSPMGGNINGEISLVYMAEVTELVVPAVTSDPDPYPHPNMFEETGEHIPWLITPANEPLTTENGEHITI